MGHHRHSQQVIDPLGRSLSLITVPTPEHYDWLFHEARALGGRRHRAIPTTYVYWPEPTTDAAHGAATVACGPGYLRHWIDGESIDTTLARRGQLSLQHAVSILRAVGSCLAGMHDSGEVHGAISTNTVWRTPLNEILMIGWQWALDPAERPQGLRPDPRWALLPPEWGSSWTPTPASDQWQLAALVLSCLAGERIASDPAPPARLVRPECPRSLADILDQALRPDPRERHLNIAALLKAVDRAIGHAPTLRSGEMLASAKTAVARTAAIAQVLRTTASGATNHDGSAFSAHEPGVASASEEAGHVQPWATPAIELQAMRAIDAERARQDAEFEQRLRAATGLDYELQAPLGRGTFGAVWRARDLSLERDVAIKGLHPWVAANPRAVARFRQEAKLVASLQHPRILAIYDLNERGGVAYFAMALAEHGSLADRIARLGARPWHEVEPQIADLLRGLAAAHDAQIVHRDLKPENIVIDRHRRWLIADFGIASRPDDEGRGTTGTPAFAAPEQLLGEAIDERCDLYALAAITWYALTGEPPFSAKHPPELVAKQLQGVAVHDPRIQHLPLQIREWMVRGLAPDPARRWGSADAMRRAWEDAVLESASDSMMGFGPFAKILMRVERQVQRGVRRFQRARTTRANDTRSNDTH